MAIPPLPCTLRQLYGTLSPGLSTSRSQGAYVSGTNLPVADNITPVHSGLRERADLFSYATGSSRRVWFHGTEPSDDTVGGLTLSVSQLPCPQCRLHARVGALHSVAKTVTRGSRLTASQLRKTTKTTSNGCSICPGADSPWPRLGAPSANHVALSMQALVMDWKPVS